VRLEPLGSRFLTAYSTRRTHGVRREWARNRARQRDREGTTTKDAWRNQRLEKNVFERAGAGIGWPLQPLAYARQESSAICSDSVRDLSLHYSVPSLKFMPIFLLWKVKNRHNHFNWNLVKWCRGKIMKFHEN
jgi:hypothetical protein